MSITKGQMVHVISRVVMPRVPRKLKKTYTRIDLDFTVEEYYNIKKAATIKGMRMNEFINYALRELLKEYDKSN